MNKTEAQLKGIPWVDFKDIPPSLKRMYDLVLAVKPIAEMVVKHNPCVKTETERTVIYENCCEYWFNNQLINAVDDVESSEVKM